MVGFLMYFESTGYADELGVGCERNRGIKNDFKVFG